MADRYPLIANSSQNQIQELANTDNLDLTGNNIVGVVDINASGNISGNVSGNITGTAATFTGNVSIGGTLTYEDVTNIDSVGIVTARSGVDFNGALKESGNVTVNTADQYPVDLINGNVYYFSTNGTTAGTIDITYNGGNNVNTFLDDGDNVAINVIAKPNNAGYITGVKIDGSLVTSEWSSDSAVAPSSANTGAYDLYSINILKTGSSAYICLCNRTKFD